MRQVGLQDPNHVKGLGEAVYMPGKLARRYRRPRYELQANLQNLANRRIYDAAQSDFQIYPAALINGSVTARYRF